MTTLVAVYNSDGCVGRCDAKCYDAVEPDCHCVCGGKNHGAGRAKAIANTRELALKWIGEYVKANNLTKYTAVIPDAVYQLSLLEDA